MGTVRLTHIPRMMRLALIWCVACGAHQTLASSPRAQDTRLAIAYTVKVSDTSAQLFHVTTDIDHLNQPALELSLPAWTPGWYTIENYAKNISRFRVTAAGGRQLPTPLVRKQTWRIDTRGISRITVEFEYRATVLAANHARIAPDYALFTGTQLFLLPEGHRSTPSVVRFDVPSGWRIASGLDDTADARTFTAPDYDTLVDQPTLMGQFDVTRFMVNGKPHDVVINPAGLFSAEKTRTLIGHLTKLADTQGQIFGGLPYRKFVYFYLFRPAEGSATALEHQNSYVMFVQEGAQAQPDAMVAGAAHEFFHVWNVKRIRPVQMWPYDYARESETPLLWVSEGFTTYYGSLTTYRAGLREARSFVDEVGRGIAEVESNEARRYISASDSSTSAWLGYGAPPPFSISYYAQGRTLAALLDLSIRHDTRGASGLDDVMRTLFTDFYQRGRGFSTEDLIRVINRITSGSYEAFFSRYVSGVEVPPYETIFGYAGYQIERTTRRLPNLGVNLNDRGRVTGAPPGADPGTTPLQQGDIIVSIDGQTLETRESGAVFRLLNEKSGQNISLKIRRGDEERDVAITVRSIELINYRIVESQSPTPEQLKIRESWLTR